MLAYWQTGGLTQPADTRALVWMHDAQHYVKASGRTRSCLLAKTRMALWRIRGSSTICCIKTHTAQQSTSYTRERHSM